MRVFDILVVYYVQKGYKEKNKDKKRELFIQVILLYIIVDRIIMYDQVSLSLKKCVFKVYKFFVFLKEYKRQMFVYISQIYISCNIIVYFQRNVISVCNKFNF